MPNITIYSCLGCPPATLWGAQGQRGGVLHLSSTNQQSFIELCWLVEQHALQRAPY